MRDINLVRKRRISVLTAAQSLAQFDHLYPARGEADRLLAGLATKVVFGGCDQRTAEFFSRVSGQRTVALSSVSRGGRTAGDSATASLRGRPLLLPDDLIRPQRGQATVFAAYTRSPSGAGTAGGRAEQAIFQAELRPFFQRKDWRMEGVEPRSPLVVPPPAPAQEKAQGPRTVGADLARHVAQGIAQSLGQGGKT